MAQEVSPSEARPRRGRPRDPAKRAAILAAARTLFLRNGFDLTSMDAVAGEAGVSKLTVYGHFTDKDELFRTIVRETCDAHAAPESFAAINGRPARETLVVIGRRFLDLLLSEEAIQLNRMMMIDGQRVPRMSQLFFEAGPERIINRLADYLKLMTTRGELDIEDPVEAADQLLSMFKGRLHMRALLGLGLQPPPAVLKRHIESAVDTFLRAFAAKRPRARR